MKLYLEKGMRIMNDLVAFCHHHGGRKFDVSLSNRNSLTTLTVSSPIAHLDEETIESLQRELNVPRRPEIEQNYWELSGECEMSEQLTLVGMMIDHAAIVYQNHVLYIHVQRYEKK